MREQPVIGIIGATGIVGNEILSILEQRKVACSEIRLFASEDSVGEVYSFNEGDVVVEALTSESFNGVDIALFATMPAVSTEFIPYALKAGSVVIDGGNYNLADVNIPLLVPEINGHLLRTDSKVILNPSSSVIELALVLNIVNKLAGLKRVVVSTYQSVSGAGKMALDELWSQTLAIFSQKEVLCEAFQHQIAFNCIPQIDVMLESGETKEEARVVSDTRRILGLPELKISCTAVRVPVFHCDALSLNIETVSEITPEKLIECLEKNATFQVYQNFDEFPMPLDVSTSDCVHVGRIRSDLSVQHGLNLWVVTDNIRRGAALNMVQIVEKLINIDAKYSSSTRV